MAGSGDRPATQGHFQCWCSGTNGRLVKYQDGLYNGAYPIAMTLMACVSRSLLLLAVLGVVSAQIACNYKPPGFDATFDLSELHRPDTNAGYRVLDHERDVRNYTYVFNSESFFFVVRDVKCVVGADCCLLCFMLAVCGVAKPTTPCNFTSSGAASCL